MGPKRGEVTSTSVVTQEDSPAGGEPNCECQGDPRAAGDENRDRNGDEGWDRGFKGSPGDPRCLMR